MRGLVRAPSGATAGAGGEDVEDTGAPSTAEELTEFVKDFTNWQMETEEKSKEIHDFVDKYTNLYADKELDRTKSQFQKAFEECMEQAETQKFQIPKGAASLVWPTVAISIIKRTLDHLMAITRLQSVVQSRSDFVNEYTPQDSGYVTSLAVDEKLHQKASELKQVIKETIAAKAFPSADEAAFLTVLTLTNTTIATLEETRETELQLQAPSFQ